MSDIVDETVTLWRSTPFLYGESDCMLSVGDYIARRGGKDVTEMFRGQYSTQQQALAHMHHFGGAAGLIDMTGIERIDRDDLQRGDVVALACEAAEGGAIGGICTGPGVVVRRDVGVLEADCRFVALKGVWRCPA